MDPESGVWSAELLAREQWIDEEEGIIRLDGETRRFTAETYPDFVLDK